jgi:hypothetical protein
MASLPVTNRTDILRGIAERTGSCDRRAAMKIRACRLPVDLDQNIPRQSIRNLCDYGVVYSNG